MEAFGRFLIVVLVAALGVVASWVGVVLIDHVGGLMALLNIVVGISLGILLAFVLLGVLFYIIWGED